MSKTLSFPGFIDVHVHFRDPGDPGAETVGSGLAAAKRGGFAAVVTMPNTMPACDSPEIMEGQRLKASACREYDADAPVLLASACITRGRLGREVADLERLAEAGAAFFTDDGAYVADAMVMEAAMRRAAALGMTISQHALAAGVSEAEAIRRDLAICRVTGCRLHIQHISTAEGVELVRSAQKEGLPVTAEATPHHILLCRDDIAGDDGNYKMAPPLASAEDRAEVRWAVRDGVLMFATDHAPHRAATKNCGYAKAANGIVGLETAVAITYAAMVEDEGMPVDDWARAWCEMPKRVLSRAALAAIDGRMRPTTVEVGVPRAVDAKDFVSRSHNCPYDGRVFDCWPAQFKKG